MKIKNNIFRIFFFIIIILFLSENNFQRKKYSEFPAYRVVLDPGHGGVNNSVVPENSEKYDSISKKYLSKFKYGATYRGLKEHLIVYKLSEKVHNILKNCDSNGDFYKFRKILSKYTDKYIPRVIIKTIKSRKRSITRKEISKSKDPNADYRFFDYPNENGEIQPGRLSRINKFNPHLVVSIHLARSGSVEYVGMSPVIAAPPALMKKGLKYLKKDLKNNKFFTKSKYKKWFSYGPGRTDWKWFLDDVSFYYTGFSLKNNLQVRLNSFKGYRYNMLSWKYEDKKGWEKIVGKHKKNSKYSSNYKNFTPIGKFWERENSIYEDYRRAGGLEGYGGDNYYTSNELIRFMLYSLYKKGIKNKKYKVGKSYNGVWILPIHVNAITAFIELGYLDRKRDRYIIIDKMDELAEGMAVGIYSLFTGIKIDSKYKYKPKGNKVDFNKYNNYFDIVNDK